MAYERAGYTTGSTYSPKHLLANDDDVTTRKVTIASGNNLVAGSVIGAILATAAQTVTAGAAQSGGGGTVGNGSIGTPTADAGAMPGTWLVRITAESSNAGSFVVQRPDGTIDGNGTVAVAYDGQLNFTLADGSNDWKEDDVIPITVSYDEAALEFKLSLAAATDGSQTPMYVLAEDVDASSAAKEGIAYETATVVKTALTLGTGHTVTSIRAGLRDKGIKIDD